jgi:TRAP-type C4-dicarboxylate transport system permease small subunit
MTNGTAATTGASVGRAVAWADRLLRVLALLAGIVLVGVALVIVANVIMRYIFNDPIFGAFDIIQMAMVLAIFGAMAYCCRTGGHVSVDVLSNVFGQGFWRIADGLVRLLTAGMFGLLTWRAVISANSAAEWGESTNLLHLPHAPFWWAIGVGGGLSALIYGIEAVLIWLGLRKPGDGGVHD